MVYLYRLINLLTPLKAQPLYPMMKWVGLHLLILDWPN